MTYNYVTVYGDDWQGLYLNGKLIKEGHCIDSEHVFKIILENGGIVETHTDRIADTQWLNDRGSLPENLSDVIVEE